MVFLKRVIPIILLFMMTAQIHAQDVKVENVSFSQRGELIVVRYDLKGQPNKKYEVKLTLSDDYGATFKIRPNAVSGAVGKNVRAGTDKQIIWEIMKDFPGGIGGEGFAFAVDAELQKGGSKWLYYLLGGGAAGTIVYFVTRGSGDDEITPSTKGSVSITIPGDI